MEILRSAQDDKRLTRDALCSGRLRNGPRINLRGPFLFDSSLAGVHDRRVDYSTTMPAITALLFARNDALRIGRALETLRFPVEILVVDDQSTDRTVAVARQYGARVIPADEFARGSTIPTAQEWVFCITPRESVSEDLEAVLFEWSLLPAGAVLPGDCFSVGVRENMDQGWISHAPPETRLVSRDWRIEPDGLPVACPKAQLLAGTIRRFSLP